MSLPLGILAPTGVSIPMLVGRVSNFAVSASAAGKFPEPPLPEPPPSLLLPDSP